MCTNNSFVLWNFSTFPMCFLCNVYLPLQIHFHLLHPALCPTRGSLDPLLPDGFGKSEARTGDLRMRRMGSWCLLPCPLPAGSSTVNCLQSSTTSGSPFHIAISFFSSPCSTCLGTLTLPDCVVSPRARYHSLLVSQI